MAAILSSSLVTCPCCAVSSLATVSRLFSFPTLTAVSGGDEAVVLSAVGCALLTGRSAEMGLSTASEWVHRTAPVDVGVVPYAGGTGVGEGWGKGTFVFRGSCRAESFGVGWSSCVSITTYSSAFILALKWILGSSWWLWNYSPCHVCTRHLTEVLLVSLEIEETKNIVYMYISCTLYKKKNMVTHSYWSERVVYDLVAFYLY